VVVADVRAVLVLVCFADAVDSEVGFEAFGVSGEPKVVAGGGVPIVRGRGGGVVEVERVGAEGGDAAFVVGRTAASAAADGASRRRR